MDKSMYGKMSDDRRTEERPTCGLTNRPAKEGHMRDKEKLKENINKMIDGASESKVRILWIVAQQILSK